MEVIWEIYGGNMERVRGVENIGIGITLESDENNMGTHSMGIILAYMMWE